MIKEEVLGVPRDVLNSCGYFEGFAKMTPAYEPLFAAENQAFMLREPAEKDPSFKQLIPYIVVVRNSLVLNYFRGKGQGEARLRGKRSLGIGGHINPCDLTDAVIGVLKDRPSYLDDKYVRGMLRELHEELKFPTHLPEIWDAPIVGLINEDQTEVGKVHLGVVHLLKLDFGQKVQAREEDILDLSWTNAEVLMQDEEFEQFERWSQICLPPLMGKWADKKPKKIHAPVPAPRADKIRPAK
jgi:predicted NUDIX family phosphoesterase